MPVTTTDRERQGDRRRTALRRVGWFVALYLGSLAAWLLFSYGLKGLMGLGGT